MVESAEKTFEQIENNNKSSSEILANF